MLNMRKVNSEFIGDADMYLFFEKVMRGGVCYISKRHSKTNYNFLKSYDQKKARIKTYYVFYMVIWCLKFFPRNEFKWVNPRDFDSNKHTSNRSKICDLKVDLEYP